MRFLLLILFLFTFLPLTDVGYTTNDETHLYFCHAYSWANLFWEIVNSYKLAFLNWLNLSRPPLTAVIIAPLVSLLSATYRHPPLMRAVSIVGHALNLFLFCRLLTLVSKSVRIGSIGAVLFLVFIQNSWDHNLMTSYVLQLYYCSFVLLALISFLLYLEQSERRAMLWSAFFYFLSLSYETNIVYFPAFMFLAFAQERSSANGDVLSTLRRSFSRCRYILGVTLLYLFVYSLAHHHATQHNIELVKAFALTNPETHSGYSLATGSGSIRRVLDVIFCHGAASFPAFVYAYRHGFVVEYSKSLSGHALNPFSWIGGIEVSWLVKALVAGFSARYLLLALRRRDILHVPLFPAIIVGFYLIFIPGVPVSLIGKYQDWVQSGTLGYVNTYHSLYGTVFLTLALLAHLIVHLRDSHERRYRGPLRTIVIGGLSLVVALICVVTDSSNSAFAVSQIQSNQKWKSVDLFIQSDEFRRIPAGSVIYAPSLFSQIGIMKVFPPYWTDYISYKTGGTYDILDNPALIPSYLKNPRIIFDKPGGKKIQVVGSWEELEGVADTRKPKNLYCLKFSQEKRAPNQFLVFGKVSSVGMSEAGARFFGDEVYLFTLSHYRNFNLFGSRAASRDIRVLTVDGVPRQRLRGDSFSISIEKDGEKTVPLKTKIAIAEIDVESVHISNFLN